MRFTRFSATTPNRPRDGGLCFLRRVFENRFDRRIPSGASQSDLEIRAAIAQNFDSFGISFVIREYQSRIAAFVCLIRLCAVVE